MFEKVRPPYILFSFATVLSGGKKSEKIMRCVQSDWCKDFLLDSGAFTYRQKAKTMSLQSFDSYVDKYIEFINTYNVKHFFEMDIDNIVGLEKVEEYRARIERRTGKQSIPVWHSNRGWQYFVDMCKEYSYVSIGGIAKNPNGKKLEKIFPYFIEHAHKNCVEMHGLGYTDIKNLKKYPFDSVDSTSWSSGSRYGITFELRGNSLVGKKNIFPDKKLHGKSIDLHNLKVWTQFAKSIDH